VFLLRKKKKNIPIQTGRGRKNCHTKRKMKGEWEIRVLDGREENQGKEKLPPSNGKKQFEK